MATSTTTSPLSPIPLTMLDGFLAGRATQRVQRLAALLAIYTLGLSLVFVLQDGADIGSILAALFAHGVYVIVRTLMHQRGDQTIARIVSERRRRFAPATSGGTMRTVCP